MSGSHPLELKNTSEDGFGSIIGRLIAQFTDSEPGSRLEDEELVKNVGAVALEGAWGSSVSV